jgi:hydroxyisourate hydrolase
MQGRFEISARGMNSIDPRSNGADQVLQCAVVTDGGRLTTHVLDVALGRPASGVAIELVAIGSDGAVTSLAHVVTNADGRTDAPLLAGAAFAAGVYELRFAVGAYFAAAGDPPFLDVVPVRFGVSDPAAPHHVALLVTPWSYSTYRGS